MKPHTLGEFEARLQQLYPDPAGSVTIQAGRWDGVWIVRLTAHNNAPVQAEGTSLAAALIALLWEGAP